MNELKNVRTQRNVGDETVQRVHRVTPNVVEIKCGLQMFKRSKILVSHELWQQGRL